MRTSRKNRLGPDTAERLLTTGRDPAFPQLSRLHAAASAPPRPHELVGLEAALAAFEEASLVRHPAPAKPRRRLSRPFAVSVAVATALVGGVAVAAETGSLPVGRAPRGDHATTAGASPDGTRATPGGSATPATPPSSGPAGRTLSPTSPAVTALCLAWDRHRRNGGGPPENAEALRQLATAAGGEERIPAFCAPVLPATSATPTTHPGTVPPTPSHPAGKSPTKPPPPSTGRKGQ